MIWRRSMLSGAALISALIFPWPLTAALAVVGALADPLLPLAAGIFIDTLYFVPHEGAVPFATLAGACVSAVAFFVRNRLTTSIIR